MGKAFDAILTEPWAITPEGLEQILAVANRQGEDLEALAARLGRPLQNTQEATMRDGVAVLPIRGPIMRYSNLFTQISGATSLEIAARDFTAAVEDASVSRIVLDIDSPGGQTNGVSEFAAMIRAADKPVTAYIGGMGASAAYWLAAAADNIVASDTAMLGSIGVVGTYRPTKDGSIKIISSQSPLKQATPETEAGRAEMQRVIDDLADVFVATVASYRGVTEETVMQQFGRGGVLIGAHAVAAGMADRLGTLEQVIAADVEPEPLRAEIERTRQRQQDGGHISPPANPVVKPVIEDHPMIDNMQALEDEILAASLDPTGVEMRVRDEWQRNQDMRQEFGQVETAVSYFQAVARGNAKRLANQGGLSRGRV